MRAPFKVFPLVSWCELATSKDLIGLSRCLEWELLINSTRVDEERSFRNGGVFLEFLKDKIDERHGQNVKDNRRECMIE